MRLKQEAEGTKEHGKKGRSVRESLLKILVCKIIKIRRMIQVNQSCFPKSRFLNNHRKLADLFFA